MNHYILTLYLLFAALLCQALISGLALNCCLQRDQPAGRRVMWLAFSSGALLLALNHGSALDLAVETGIYDFRQAALAMFGGLLTAFAVWQLKRQLA